MTRQRRKLCSREQVLGAKQPGERGDAELAPALRLLAKVLFSMQQSACAALLFSLTAWFSTLEQQSRHMIPLLLKVDA